MDQNREIYEQIDRYLRKQMTEEERLTFEQALTTDSTLAQEVALQKDLAGGIRAHHNQKLKNKLNQIHEEVQPGKTADRGRRKWLYPLLAVAAASLLFLVIRQNFPKEKLSPEALFAQYYQPQTLSLASRDVNANETLVAIDDFYKKGDFNAVVPRIESTLAAIARGEQTEEELKEAQPKLLLACGIAQLENREVKKAMRYFGRLIRQNDPFLKDHARWYLALSHLQVNEVEACRKQLLELSKDKRADHYKEAIALLKQL